MTSQRRGRAEGSAGIRRRRTVISAAQSIQVLYVVEAMIVNSLGVGSIIVYKTWLQEQGDCMENMNPNYIICGPFIDVDNTIDNYVMFLADVT